MLPSTQKFCYSGINMENLINLLSIQRSNRSNSSSHNKTLARNHMARKEIMEANGRRRKMNADTNLTPSSMYLVFPNSAELRKIAIKKILDAEKAKLCTNSQLKKCFDNIEFKIAFANSKNIKQLIVRTKI